MYCKSSDLPAHFIGFKWLCLLPFTAHIAGREGAGDINVQVNSDELILLLWLTRYQWLFIEAKEVCRSNKLKLNQVSFLVVVPRAFIARSTV